MKLRSGQTARRSTVYWFVFLDANNPRVKAKEWVWPGKQNAEVPPGIDTYLQDPNYIFAVVTQTPYHAEPAARPVV